MNSLIRFLKGRDVGELTLWMLTIVVGVGGPVLGLVMIFGWIGYVIVMGQ